MEENLIDERFHNYEQESVFVNEMVNTLYYKYSIYDLVMMIVDKKKSSDSCVLLSPAWPVY